MKAILKYDFNHADDNILFQHASKGSDYFLALGEIDCYLRSQINDGERPNEQSDVFQEVREKLWQILNEFNIELLRRLISD